MNKYIKEGLWFCAPLLLTFISYILLSGTIGNGNMSINIKDTYLVFDAPMFFMAVFIAFGFLFYLIRTIILKFRNITSNSILLVFNSAFIILWTQIIILENSMQGWTIYPPLSAMTPEMQEQMKESMVNPIISLSVIIRFFQFALVILLAYTAFITGKKYAELKHEV